ncbi:MAG: DNA cytosine methyltransferase [Lachnospiraceae bacterium]|nr:DNA cytosine methyltransferase [Lachnospiraceae bacterium]
MRVADFFCGAGGFSEGFRQAGFEIVFAVDKWEPAVTTYKGNKPGVNVIQDDVINISKLPDQEFEELVPDSEVIIGSPPCQAFSHSNKSGNADKSLGIELIEAYLRIIVRKKFKPNSILKYWVLENVPNVKEYIKEEYTADDFGLAGDFVLHPHKGAAGIYNAKYYGAPTNRKRYLCGEFPTPIKTHTDETAVTLGSVLSSLGDPLGGIPKTIVDVNYPDLKMDRYNVSDHLYVHELAPFEWNVAKRLKQDKGYMGRMSFPENLDRPSRTVMATMSASSREAMILGYENGKYRLPTVRETASMMSFPIDYRFYGKSKGIKHTLVGNSVPPKLSFALAKAIALDSGEQIPDHYLPIQHDSGLEFFNLNGRDIPINEERPRRSVAKFKYHIPYLILDAYRVELTNYKSNFKSSNFRWNVELHYSQGKAKAAVFTPDIIERQIPEAYREPVEHYLEQIQNKVVSYNQFQEMFCLTTNQRKELDGWGPYELLDDIKRFIDNLLSNEAKSIQIETECVPKQLPLAIVVGYYLLDEIVKKMGGLSNGCNNSQDKTG